MLSGRLCGSCPSPVPAEGAAHGTTRERRRLSRVEASFRMTCTGTSSCTWSISQTARREPCQIKVYRLHSSPRPWPSAPTLPQPAAWSGEQRSPSWPRPSLGPRRPVGDNTVRDPRRSYRPRLKLFDWLPIARPWKQRRPWPTVSCVRLPAIHVMRHGSATGAPRFAESATSANFHQEARYAPVGSVGTTSRPPKWIKPQHASGTRVRR
jgi:hypothetical protein